MRFNQFLATEDEEEEEARRRGFDPAELLRFAKDPSAGMASASSDPRQGRRPDGLETALGVTEARMEKSAIPTLAAGDITGSANTAKRIAGVGRMFYDEEQDESAALPMELSTPNEQPRTPAEKMSSTPEASPVKPPGPDSPAPNYKDPAGKFLADAGYYDKKAAYEKDFGPGKKHKWYSLESTKQWENRRDSGQRDLMLAEREGTTAYQRAREDKQTQAPRERRVFKMVEDRTQDGKKRWLSVFDDGSTEVTLEGLDDLAKGEDQYSDQISYDAQGRAYKTKKGSVETQFLRDPQAGLPLADTVSGGPTLQGPTDPYVDRWVAPPKEQTRVLGRGQTLVGSGGDVIARGEPIPAKAPAAAKDPDGALRQKAVDYSMRMAEEDVKAANAAASTPLTPAAQDAMRKNRRLFHKNDFLAQYEIAPDEPKGPAGKGKIHVPGN